MPGSGEVYGSHLGVNLLFGTILAVKIWKWVLDSWKMCGLLPHDSSDFTAIGNVFVTCHLQISEAAVAIFSSKLFTAMPLFSVLISSFALITILIQFVCCKANTTLNDFLLYFVKY